MFFLLLIHFFIRLVEKAHQLHTFMYLRNSNDAAAETARISSVMIMTELYLYLMDLFLSCLYRTVSYDHTKLISINPGKQILRPYTALDHTDEITDINISFVSSSSSMRLKK